MRCLLSRHSKKCGMWRRLTSYETLWTGHACLNGPLVMNSLKAWQNGDFREIYIYQSCCTHISMNIYVCYVYIYVYNIVYLCMHIKYSMNSAMCLMKCMCFTPWSPEAIRRSKMSIRRGRWGVQSDFVRQWGMTKKWGMAEESNMYTWRQLSAGYEMKPRSCSWLP